MTTKYNFLDNILRDQQYGIGQYIKENIFDEYSQIIFVTLAVLLIILVVILYKYTFAKYNTETLSKINYSDKLQLKPLPPCSKLPEELQYRLCDYYVAASFNTPNLGNQQLDYVSADMIAKALTSGARFIQLPVCAYTVDQETYPVIAQSQPGKQHITSLNTISTREALVVIRDFAFKYIDNRANKLFSSGESQVTSYSKINYPLIIQLKLHTQNDYVLNILYQDIRDILSKYLVDASTYKNYPIHLEKLCMLLNKIIIISTPGYETSKLVDIVVPMGRLFQTLTSNTLATKELSPETAEQYFKGLSMIKQRESYQYAANLPTIINQLLDSQTNDNILVAELENKVRPGENPELSDKLSIYNMVGMTLIEPIDSSVTDSSNYNPIIPFTYGCQFVAMNYQTPDKYMDLYLKIFQKSSFVLKPSGLRLPITEAGLRDKLDKYTLSMSGHSRKLNINPLFIYETDSRVISLTPVANPETIFAPISDTKISLVNKPGKPALNNLFVVKQSPLTNNTLRGSGGDLVVIASASNPEQVVTISENFTELGKQSTVQLETFDSNNISKLRYQSFYPEKGVSSGKGNSTISFRLYNDLAEQNNRDTGSTETYYLGLYGRQMRLLPLLANSTEDKELITFTYSVITSKESIRVYHLSYGTLRVYDSGIVSLSRETEPEDGTPLQIIMVRDSKSSKGLTAYARTVRIKSMTTNKFISSRNNILSCDRDANTLDDSTIFIISKNKASDNEYTIENYNGYFLNANPNGVLNLKRDKPILSPELKDSTGKVIKSARVGPSLGNNKYFKFIVDYELS